PVYQPGLLHHRHVCLAGRGRGYGVVVGEELIIEVVARLGYEVEPSHVVAYGVVVVDRAQLVDDVLRGVATLVGGDGDWVEVVRRVVVRAGVEVSVLVFAGHIAVAVGIVEEGAGALVLAWLAARVA